MALFLGYWSIDRMPGNATANGRFCNYPHYRDGRFHPDTNTIADYIFCRHPSHSYHEPCADYYHAHTFGHSDGLASHAYGHAYT
jgi:hypothetical protein